MNVLFAILLNIVFTHLSLFCVYSKIYGFKKEVFISYGRNYIMNENGVNYSTNNKKYEI